MSTAVKKPAATRGATQKKSGLRVLEAGETLFKEKDLANSLYIIQKGQLRLFRPKGDGFVELAVLRAGEVLGEMAFFDDDGSGGRRSCSAEALVKTEIIEISFVAFSKTLGTLNPWFKTIVTTLAKRLNRANGRIKEIESNSLGYDAGGGKSYRFIKDNELLKILCTLYLVYNAHGEKDPKGAHLINKRMLQLYTKDIYNIMEVKFEAIMHILTSLNLLEIRNDQEGLPSIFALKEIDYLKSLFTFYNTEKFLADDKKLSISTKSKIFLEEIYFAIERERVEVEEPETKNPTPFKIVNVSEIVADFKNRNMNIGIDNLEDAQDAGIVGEAYLLDAENVKLEVDPGKLSKLLPIIRFMDLFQKLNKEKREK